MLHTQIQLDPLPWPELVAALSQRLAIPIVTYAPSYWRRRSLAGSTDEVLDTIAHIADGRWAVWSGCLYLRPHLVPRVFRHEETRRRMVRRYKTAEAGEVFLALLTSFTSKQVNAFARGEAVPVRDLDDAQRALLLLVAWTSRIGRPSAANVTGGMLRVSWHPDLVPVFEGVPTIGSTVFPRALMEYVRKWGSPEWLDEAFAKTRTLDTVRRVNPPTARSLPLREILERCQVAMDPISYELEPARAQKVVVSEGPWSGLPLLLLASATAGHQVRPFRDGWCVAKPPRPEAPYEDFGHLIPSTVRVELRFAGLAGFLRRLPLPDSLVERYSLDELLDPELGPDVEAPAPAEDSTQRPTVVTSGPPERGQIVGHTPQVLLTLECRGQQHGLRYGANTTGHWLALRTAGKRLGRAPR